MKFRVILYSTLRDILPPENHGCIELELPTGCTISDVVEQFNLPGPFLCAVNGEIERNLNRSIRDKDELRFLRPGAGGSNF